MADTDDHQQVDLSQNKEVDPFFNRINIEFLIHELKDPLTVVETGAHVLLEKQMQYGTLSDRQKRVLERILRGARNARHILYELLEIGRAEAACFDCRRFHPEAALHQTLLSVIEAKDPETHDLLREIDSISGKLKYLAKQQIRFEASAATAGMTIFHDETKFRQIVGNLMKNAYQYKRRMLLVHMTRYHDQLSISVRDDGPGIAPQHHEAIFDRYKQVSPTSGIARSGHGLGLAMARTLARAMGGEVSLESELGQGATFRLSLPVQAQ